MNFIASLLSWSPCCIFLKRLSIQQIFSIFQKVITFLWSPGVARKMLICWRHILRPALEMLLLLHEMQFIPIFWFIHAHEISVSRESKYNRMLLLFSQPTFCTQINRNVGTNCLLCARNSISSQETRESTWLRCYNKRETLWKGDWQNSSAAYTVQFWQHKGNKYLSNCDLLPKLSK